MLSLLIKSVISIVLLFSILLLEIAAQEQCANTVLEKEFINPSNGKAGALIVRSSGNDDVCVDVLYGDKYYRFHEKWFNKTLDSLENLKYLEVVFNDRDSDAIFLQVPKSADCLDQESCDFIYYGASEKGRQLYGTVPAPISE